MDKNDEKNDFAWYSKFSHQLNNVFEYFRFEIINEKKKIVNIKFKNVCFAFHISPKLEEENRRKYFIFRKTR